MKKKVLYGIFMALFAVVSMGSLQSCKDDLEDFKQKTEYNEGYLSELLKTLQGDLDRTNEKLKELDADKITEDQAITIAKDVIIEMELQKQINELRDKLAELEENGNGGMDEEEVKDLIEDQLESITSQVGALVDDYEALAGLGYTSLEGLGTAVNGMRNTLNQINDQLESLQRQINENKTEITNIKTDVNALWSQSNANMNAISVLTAAIGNMYTKEEIAAMFANYLTKTQVEELIAGLGGAGIDEEAVKTLIENALKDKGYLTKSEVETLISQAVAGKLDQTQVQNLINTALTNYYTTNQIDEKLSNFYNKTEVYTKTELQEWLNKITENGTNIGKLLPLIDKVADLEDDVADLISRMEDVEAYLDMETSPLWKQINDNKEAIANLTSRFEKELSDVNNELARLSGAVDIINDRLNKQITGIIVQGSFNSMFGTLNLPVGIKSNILFNWYGRYTGPGMTFPSSSMSDNYIKDKSLVALTDDDLIFLNPEYLQLSNGEYLTDGNLGRVYLTVNPVGIDFNGSTFNLETSNGTRLPYTLDPIKPSDEELTFGYSRTDMNTKNGFYEADVNMLNLPDGKTNANIEKAINATKIEIEQGLKSAVKDALKDRTKRNAVNLMKAVYSQIDGFLPAYAVRGDWTTNKGTDAEQTFGVLSNYDLAITTAHPLSYGFYANGNELTGFRLRNFGHLDNLFDRLIGDIDDFHFNLKDNTIKLNDVEIKIDKLEFDFEVNPEVNVDDVVIKIWIPDMEAQGVVKDDNGIPTGDVVDVTVPGRWVDVKGESFDDLIDAINKGFKDAIDKMSTQLSDQINTEIQTKIVQKIQDTVNNMLADVEKQFNDMLEKMEGDINGKIDDLISDIESKVNSLGSKFNRFIDLYNRFANQINRMLAHPNNYLQPAMFYTHNSGKGVSVVSTKLSSPTPFHGNGSAITLYVSSYTGEIVAPAYKKYVAVSNVYEKQNGNYVSVRNSKGNVKEINAASHLNRVLPGGQKRVAIDASKMVPGLVYEIVYQGLDYKGITSSRKFYITKD